MVTGGKDVEKTFYRLFENIHVLQWQQFGVFRVEYITQKKNHFSRKEMICGEMHISKCLHDI